MKSSVPGSSRATHRLTSVIAARNGTTESTYIAEALIPLIAFGLPLSPVAAGPAAPCSTHRRVFTTDDGTGQIRNLSTALTNWEFLLYGLGAVVIAAIIAYPFAMNFAHRAATLVVRQSATRRSSPRSPAWWSSSVSGRAASSDSPSPSPSDSSAACCRGRSRSTPESCSWGTTSRSSAFPPSPRTLTLPTTW